MRLYISVSSARDWKPQFGVSVIGLICHLFQSEGLVSGFDFRTSMQASNLSGARQIAIDNAIREEYTHILFLDDDMQFPHDIVDRLACHGRDIIGCNYHRKNPDKVEGTCSDFNAVPIQSEDRTGIEEVGFIGFGCVLIDLKKVKEVSRPHFEIVWNPNTNTYWTEDNVFCGKMRQNGLQIYVDHDTSKLIRHVGDYCF